MARLRYNLLETTLGAQLNSASTSITFAVKLTAADGDIPTISGGDYLPLTIEDEIVYLTAYTSAATSGTISRGEEGTTDATHVDTTAVRNTPTVLDYAGSMQVVTRTAGNLTLNNTSWTQLPSVSTISLPAKAGDFIEVGVSWVHGVQNVDGNYDVGTFVSSSLVNRFSGNSSTVGVSGWYAQGSTTFATPVSGSIIYKLLSGDVSGGVVDLRLMYKTGSATNKTLQATTGVPMFWWAKNLGD